MMLFKECSIQIIPTLEVVSAPPIPYLALVTGWPGQLVLCYATAEPSLPPIDQ